MTRTDRRIGRQIRKAPATARRALKAVANLDRQWREAGKPADGRLVNRLAFELGNAARAGAGKRDRMIQTINAQARGERSGWESYLGMAQ